MSQTALFGQARIKHGLREIAELSGAGAPQLLGMDSQLLQKMKILHVTTNHRRDDARIFQKMCRSLSGKYDVELLVADGLGPEATEGVQIIDAGRKTGRFDKFLGAPRRVFSKALKSEAQYIHFHDGTFLPWAIALGIVGRKLVYDVHEDYPRQVMNWRFAWPIRKAASLTYIGLEWVGTKLFHKIVAATPKIAERFPASKTLLVRNFPQVRPRVEGPRPKNRFVYIGGIAQIRGYSEMKEAIATLDADLCFAGPCMSEKIADELEHDPPPNVHYFGVVDRDGVEKLLTSASAGLCVLHPRKNYLDALPVKLFEYMEAGLPFIASDFPVWRQLAEGCGIFVDPCDVSAVRGAMEWIVLHPEKSAEMGATGRLQIERLLNWDREANTLLRAYA